MLVQLLGFQSIISIITYVLAFSIFSFFILSFAVSWRSTVSPSRGLRKLCRVKASNLTDQYDPTYSGESKEFNNGPSRIKALYIHPIKSCKPIEVDRILLTKIGLAYDRCFAFATDDKDVGPDGLPVWRMITQRTIPQMSQITVELWVPHNDLQLVDPLSPEAGCLIVSFPSPHQLSPFEKLMTFCETWSWSTATQVRFKIPLMPTSAQIARHNIQETPFTILSRTARGLDLGTLPAMESILPRLKTFLKIPSQRKLTLFRCTPNTLHRTDESNNAPIEYIGTKAIHGYTDDHPVHLINLATVHAVSKLLPEENQPLNARRFRANIYIAGSPAYDEEEWKRFRVRTKSPSDIPARLSVVCRTNRCPMPNVNPDTGLVSHENPVGDKKKGKPQPSTTLKEHRMVEDAVNGALGYMGMHCTPEDDNLKEARDQGLGVYISVGDSVDVLERGTHVWGSTKYDD